MVSSELNIGECNRKSGDRMKVIKLEGVERFTCIELVPDAEIVLV